MIYMPFCNTEITFLDKQGMIQSLLDIDANNILLVMSESSVHRWNMMQLVTDLQSKCEKSKGEFIWINQILPNPTQKDIVNCLRGIGEKRVDIIVACGGGSSIDIAKAISAFYSRENNSQYTLEAITSSLKSKDYASHDFIDIIAVPTTAGTGSEVTQWATIWDEFKRSKFSIDDPRLKPKKAIIVPELTISMPAILTVTTGLDAMSHAIEAFWSKKTTSIVQEIAYRAVELIVNNLRKAVEQPDNYDVREKLSSASLLAGMAFAQTRTTACHSISYPLTLLYDIPHGLAVSITLHSLAQLNRGHFKNDNELFSLFEKYEGIKNFIGMVCDGIVEMRLRSFNITEQDIQLIADNAFTEGRMDNNPVSLSRDDVRKILLSVL